jgi:hypothetical protein
MKDGCGGCAPVSRRRRDRGTTFVEILVSIVLLGTAVGGTLTALRTTIISGERDDGQADARTWLLAAADALYQAPYYSCEAPVPGLPAGPDPDEGIDAGEIWASYEAAIAAAPRPSGWSTAIIDVPNVQFWQKSNGVEGWNPACPADPTAIRQSAQLVTIYVLSPNGTVGKTIQVVKNGG